MLTSGSYATESCEPCQVRNEAALSRPLRVTWGRLDRVNCRGNAYGIFTKQTARINKQWQWVMYKKKKIRIFLCKHKYANLFLFIQIRRGLRLRWVGVTSRYTRFIVNVKSGQIQNGEILNVEKIVFLYINW